MKKKDDAQKVAGKLAALALTRLKNFSEEEQEERIAAAERRLASALRAGSPRTSSSTARTRKNRVSARGR
jgi:hypothetical protein